MKYLSVCSGIEAATVAWKGLGWIPFAFSEIEKFPSAVLKHHYPDVPNLGDMTKFKEWPDAAIDVLVGGTPCQSFSVAGLRKGLDDPRGNLMLTYCAIADRYRPRWLVWENVPGVLSSNEGRDFGALLGALGKLGYGFAYRILDAQYIRVESHYRAVPQRRRRVFVVGYLGDWRRAAAVLFERKSLSGDSPPRREAGQAVAAITANGIGTCGADDNQGQADHLIGYANAGHFGTMKQVEASDPLRAKGGDTGNGGETLIACDTTQITSAANYSNPKPGDPCLPLAAGAHPPAVAFPWQSALDPIGRPDNVSGTLVKNQVMGCMTSDMAVRRLTPVECERLQGFPDNYTRIPWRSKSAVDCPDGPRHKALGNSMAVPVMRWIGERITQVDRIGA